VIGAEGQAIVWSTAEQLEVAARSSAIDPNESATPLTAADIPLVPDVVRALNGSPIRDQGGLII